MRQWLNQILEAADAVGLGEPSVQEVLQNGAGQALVLLGAALALTEPAEMAGMGT
ncbi:hypothetical protein [Streptomyces aureus]|uniref:hypothetical protein n=1 Tax=Streptomyces aureus TaxID=193461 RepID=UPI0031DB0B78